MKLVVNCIVVLFSLFFCFACKKTDAISLKDQTAEQVVEKPAHFFIYSDIVGELRYVRSWSEKPIVLAINVYDEPEDYCISQDKNFLAFRIFGTIYIYDLIKDREVKRFTSSVTGMMKWSSDNKYLYVYDTRFKSTIFELDVSTGRAFSKWSQSNINKIVSIEVDSNNTILFTLNENITTGNTTIYRSSFYRMTASSVSKLKSIDYTSSNERVNGMVLSMSDNYGTVRITYPRINNKDYFSSPYNTSDINGSLYKKVNSTLTFYYSNYTCHFEYKDALGYNIRETYPYYEGRIDDILK